ncbi:MAG TPA: ABC transporter ATP-binding protein [Acidimicrobiales bacterium]|nr:ABC transporter ATP-binding protein [Acidimicrobiales bacterium]
MPEPALATGEKVDIVAATKTFGPKAALAGLDLRVEPGTFVVLLGPSGSGKTTLLRCLAGIERLTGGTIAIGGEAVAGPGLHLPPERRRLAMVFQDYALWPHMTALRNVAFPLRQMKVARSEARGRAMEMLERVGLARLVERYPNELSGGEQQRVALARALVGGVGLLLFDEPLSNLDADMREQLRLAISTLARDSGATSVYITHDQSEAFSLADYVGVLRDGRLVQWGAPEELYRQPSSPFVARFTGICTEMPVTRVGEAAGLPGAQVVDVRLPGPAGAVVSATLPSPASNGAALQMFVRPSAVQIVEPRDAQIMAQVRDVAFAGRGYEHALAADGPLLFTKTFSDRRWERGASVGVRLVPEGCLVLPADGEAGPAGTPVATQSAAAGAK